MPASSIVQRGLTVGMLLASPAFAQQHEHGATTTEKLGAVSFSTSCSPAAQPLFNRAVALLHSFEFARAIDGFSTTLTRIPPAPWRNGALRSAAGAIRSRRHSPGRAAAAGTRRCRARAAIGAKTPASGLCGRGWQSLRRFRDGGSDARAARVSRCDGEGGGGLSGRQRSGDFYALSLPRRISRRQDLRGALKAGAILEPLFAAAGSSRASRTTSSTPTTCRRSRIGRSRRPGATRRSRRRRRTRSTCRRIRSRARLLARIDRDQHCVRRGGAKRERLGAEELHAMDYRITRSCRPAQDGGAPGCSRRCPR